jgi:Txe/YoeB family toxin of Txe-Axe toxin-antitoxin module
MADIPAAPAPAAPTSTPPAADTSAKPKADLGPNSKLAEPKAPVDATGKAPETPSEKKEAERRKYKLKVDGQEFEEDLNDDEIAIRLQKARAAERRMQESAEVKKAARQLFEDLKRDPWSVLSSPEFGVDLEQIAEQRLAEKYKAELMNDEQRRAYELQKKVEAYEGQEKYRKEAEANSRRQDLERKTFEQIRQRHVSTAKAHGLPQDMRTLSIMAEVDLMNHEYGIELTEAQLASEVNARIEQPLDSVKKLKGADLLTRLGPDVVNEILRAKVAEFKSKQINPQNTPAKVQTKRDGEAEESPFESRRNSLNEWRKWRRQ